MTRSPAGCISLTFDDGPHPWWTPAVLAELRRHGVRATFFVIAPLAARHPSLVHAIRADGHDVALHCHRHVRHTELTPAEIEDDTRTALSALEELGVRPTAWRTPWGVMTEETRHVARRHDLRLVHWTADTEDWAGHPVRAMLDRVVPRLRDGAVVLAHDGIGPGSRRADATNTVDLIEPLVAAAAELGLACTAPAAQSAR